jgi:hypothetical protein
MTCIFAQCLTRFNVRFAPKATEMLHCREIDPWGLRWQNFAGASDLNLIGLRFVRLARSAGAWADLNDRNDKDVDTVR